ncbi:MAG: hypothetical protein ACLRZ7_02320 [Lachnospiraceae bacterium]
MNQRKERVWKRLFSIITAFVLITAMIMGNVSYVSAAESTALPKNVTVRFERDNGTYLAKTEINLEAFKTLGEYGVTGEYEEMDFVTPLHILSEALLQAGLPNDIVLSISKYGSTWVSSMCGITSSMYYVNGVDNGTGMTAYEVKDGDDIVFIESQYINGKSTGYGFFQTEELSAGIYQPVALTYQYDSWGMETQTVPGAEVYISEKNGTKAEINTGLTTDENGKVTLMFQEAGTYIVSARSYDGDNRLASNPYCKVTVSEDGDAGTTPVVPSSALKNVTDKIQALPSAENITLKDQYAVESILWAISKLSQQDTVQLAVDMKAKLIEVTNKIDALVNEIPITDVTENKTLNWSQFLGNLGLQGVSDSKTPTTGTEIEKKWEFNIARNTNDWAATPGTPIVVGDYTYCYIGEKLRKFRTSDGVQVAEADAPGDAMFYITLAYGDGKIFVPRYSGGKTYLMAFDANTLEYVGSSAKLTYGGQSQGQTMYYDGYVYVSSYGTPGTFACFNASDFVNQAENILPAWSFNTDGSDGFGTNAGAIFVDNLCIFATSGSKSGSRASTIYAVNAKTGDIIDSMLLPNMEYVSSTITYYEKNNRIYVAASGNPGAVVRSYEINEDGTFNRVSMRAFVSDASSGGTQSSPVIYNDRLYLAGGGSAMGSGEPFHVIDAITMEEIYRIDIVSKGSVALTTAYATDDNDQTVYLYLIPNSPNRSASNSSIYESSSMYIIKDSANQTEPSFEKVDQIGVPQFCSQSLVIDKDGNMIFYNDAKGLYCYGNVNNSSITAGDLNNQIRRLTSADAYGYYNAIEVARINERIAAGNINLSGESQKKLNEVNRILSLSGEELLSYVQDGIDSLPSTIRWDDMDKVYNLLNLAKKAGISSDKLVQAKSEVDTLINNKPVQSIIDAINDLPLIEELSGSDEAAVAYVENLYATLQSDLQSLIPNYNVLVAAREKIEEIKGKKNAFKELLNGLYNLDTENSDEGLDIVIRAIEEVEEAYAALSNELSQSDMEEVTKEYNNSVLAYTKDAVISYLVDNVLAPNGVAVTVTENNKDMIGEYAKLVIGYYSTFTEEDKEIWDHEADMKIANALLNAVATFEKPTEPTTPPTLPDEDNNPVETGDAMISQIIMTGGVAMISAFVFVITRKKKETR